MKNYYEILEVSPNASQEVIEKAYRALAKKYHPDISEGSKSMAEDKFKEITEAYDTLSNIDLRKEYDLQLNSNSNSNDDSKYQELYEENKQLKNELNNFKNFSPTNSKKNSNYKSVSFTDMVKNAFKREMNKSKEEHMNSIKAFLITIFIIALVLFAFYKIPFLHKIATTFP